MKNTFDSIVRAGPIALGLSHFRHAMGFLADYKAPTGWEK
jgi:hypothetical protein